MSLLTIGSAAYDTLETPFGFREKSLGGSGVYASFAASFFAETRLVAVVGGDWNPEYSALLRSRGVDLEGLETRPGELTTHWSGRYFENMNRRETLFFKGNVMSGEYIPFVPESYKTTPFVFLGNGSPTTHSALLDEMTVRPKLIVADTMDYYIGGARPALLDLLKRIDGLILNDGEAELLTGVTSGAIAAGKKILTMGPKFVVVKKGEHGAIFIGRDGEFYLIPAFPTDRVVDPTGAGDSFAGALMGSLAAAGELTPESIKTALLRATVVASLNVEGFSLERFQTVTRAEIDERAAEFRKMLV